MTIRICLHSLSQTRSPDSAVRPAYDPLGVEDEQRAVTESVAVAVDTVGARHVSLGLEVRQQGEVKLARLGKSAVAPDAVDRDPEHLRAVAPELRKDLVVERHLIAADGTPVCRVERQDDRVAPEVRQLHLLVRCRVQLKFGSGRSRGKR
jgi:hypothetical protein